MLMRAAKISTRVRLVAWSIALAVGVSIFVAPIPAQSAEVTVTGTVSSSAGPVNSGLVSFYTDCNPQNPFGRQIRRFSAGRYTFPVAPGSYRILVEPDSGTGVYALWHNNKKSCAQADPVTVTQDTTLDLTAAAATAVVTGTVSSSLGSVDSGRISFYPECLATSGMIVSTEISNGRYTATVPAGSYRILIDPPRETGAAQSWYKNVRGITHCAEADVVTITGNTTLDLTPPLAYYDVSGEVSSSQGRINSGSVQFYTEDCDTREVVAGSGISDGRYQTQVTPGTYRVAIITEVRTASAVSWHNNKHNCAQADPVTITEDTTVNLTAAAGYEIAVTVSTSRPGRLGGNVTFYRPDCTQVVLGLLNGRGEHTFSQLSGPFKVQINVSVPTTPRTIIERWNSNKSSCADADIVDITANTNLDLVAAPAALESQTVKRLKPELAKGRTRKLPQKTEQGWPLAWKGKTATICRIANGAVRARKPGVCKITATAPARPGLRAYSKTFTIRIK